nr:nymph-specific protein N5 [Ischnura senegalensis]
MKTYMVAFVLTVFIAGLLLVESVPTAYSDELENIGLNIPQEVIGQFQADEKTNTEQNAFEQFLNTLFNMIKPGKDKHSSEDEE